MPNIFQNIASTIRRGTDIIGNLAFGDDEKRRVFQENIGQKLQETKEAGGLFLKELGAGTATARNIFAEVREKAQEYAKTPVKTEPLFLEKPAVQQLFSRETAQQIPKTILGAIQSFGPSTEEEARQQFLVRVGKDMYLDPTGAVGSIEDVSKRAISKGLSSISKAKVLPKELESLAQEARKYKSAEEFVRALRKDEKLVFHATDKDITTFDSNKKGVFFTNESGAKLINEFDKTRFSKIQEAFIDIKNPFIVNEKNLKQLFLENRDLATHLDGLVGLQTFNDAPNFFTKNALGKFQRSVSKVRDPIVDEIRAKGFDSMIIPDDVFGELFSGKEFTVKSIAVFDNSLIKTKSQLTDFYNQAVRGAEIPVRGVGGMTDRGFIKSVQELLPKADKVAGQYVPRSTDEIAIKAVNLIKDNPGLAEKIALTRSDDSAVAIASELIKKYGDDASRATDATQSAALYDKAAQIANTLAPKLTEQGRSIQAASILGRLTPEGQIRFAAREIQRFNELNPTRAISELTGEQAKHIAEEMKAIQFMVDGTERAMRFQKLQEFIQDIIPTPLVKKLLTVWKAGLLTGIKTQGLNIFSNLAHGTTEIIKDLPAVAIDSAASLFTKERTKTFNVLGVFEGIKEGAIKGKRYFLTGFDERNIGAKLDYRRVNFGKGSVAKAFQVYTDTVFRFLGAQDQPFYYAALSRSLMDQSLAMGLNKGLKGKELVSFAYDIVKSPTEEMIRYGVADATTAVFQNKTKLGEAARAIQKIPGGEFVLPFGRTPSAVAMQIVNYSPVGIVKTIFENIGKGKFDQRLFSQGVGRGITGTAIIAIGMELSRRGMISLDYPVGDEREQELQKAEGVKPNAIKIDEKWRSPTVLGPAGNLLLVGGNLQLATEQEGSPTAALSKAMFGGLKAFLEQTFLTGLKDAVNAITDPERYAKSYLPNLLASFVPTLVSDVSRSADPLERRAETTLQRVQARVPGVRQALEPQIDILGRERQRVGNALEVLADPTRPSPDVGTVVTDELRRLSQKGFRVSPTMLGDRKGFKNMTQKENTELWELSGQILNEKLESLFKSEKYQDSPDDAKAKVVEGFVSKSKVNARAAMVMKITDGMSGNELKEKLSKLKEGGLITREVFEKYKEIR